MKLISYLCCFCLLLPLYGNAQNVSANGYRDSLAHILTGRASDSIKARASFLLSDEWSMTDTAKAAEFLEQGRIYSGANRYLQALYQFYSAMLLFDKDRRTAEQVFLRTDTLLSSFTMPEAYYFRARCWHNYGALREKEDDSKTMLAVLIDKAIPLAIKSGNKEYLAQNYADIGLIFMNRWQYEKAKSYYDKAIALLKETTQSRADNIFIYINAIRNLLYMDKLGEAKQLIDYSQQMVLPGTEAEIAFLTNQGIYFNEIKQYQNSLNVLDRALKVAQDLKFPYLAESVMFQQYRVFTGMRKYEKAKNVLLRVIDNPTLNYSQNRLMEYYELAATYSKLGDMASAYKWQQAYGVLLDSIGKQRLANEINALEIKFRNVENQQKIVALNAENAKTHYMVKSSRLINWLLGSASLFLLVVIVLGYFFYRYNKRNEVQQEKIKITQAMLKGQEDERKRVARDLHDGLGGMLASVKINLSGFAQEKERNNIELYNIINNLDNSVKELRRIAHNMMPEMLLKLGLEASLKDLCESHLSERLKISFHCLGIKSTIPVEKQITIYRIIQELLANVVKHADAKNVLLQCSQTDDVFFITIEDDGKGFDTTAISGTAGIGLNNIRSRVAYLQGRMEILSGSDQQGTSINIEVHVNS